MNDGVQRIFQAMKLCNTKMVDTCYYKKIKKGTCSKKRERKQEFFFN